jgi:hypothetical protein
MGNQTDGIKLDMDEDGQVGITEDSMPDLQECFGGVMCPHCKIVQKTVKLDDQVFRELTQLWCNHKDRSVVDIFYDELARCPLDYWIKAAMPKVYPIFASPSPSPEAK